MLDPRETGRLNEFTLDALCGMIAGSETTLPQLNASNGEDLELLTEEELLSYI